MIRFRSEVTIDRSPEQVWALLADARRYPEWMDVRQVRVVRGRPDQAGSALAMTMLAFGRASEIDVDVVEAVPWQRIVWRLVRGGPVRGEYRVTLTPDGKGGTRATYEGEVQLSGLWRLLTPIAAGEVRRGEDRELRRLKALVEGQRTNELASVMA